MNVNITRFQMFVIICMGIVSMGMCYTGYISYKAKVASDKIIAQKKIESVKPVIDEETPASPILHTTVSWDRLVSKEDNMYSVVCDREKFNCAGTVLGKNVNITFQSTIKENMPVVRNERVIYPNNQETFNITYNDKIFLCTYFTIDSHNIFCNDEKGHYLLNNDKNIVLTLYKLFIKGNIHIQEGNI